MIQTITIDNKIFPEYRKKATILGTTFFLAECYHQKKFFVVRLEPQNWR